MSNILKFEGYNYLRQRLTLSTLSGKPIRIEKIRSDDENPGLRGIFQIFMHVFIHSIQISNIVLY